MACFARSDGWRLDADLDFFYFPRVSISYITQNPRIELVPRHGCGIQHSHDSRGKSSHRYFTTRWLPKQTGKVFHSMTNLHNFETFFFSSVLFYWYFTFHYRKLSKFCRFEVAQTYQWKTLDKNEIKECIFMGLGAKRWLMLKFVTLRHNCCMCNLFILDQLCLAVNS